MDSDGANKLIALMRSYIDVGRAEFVGKTFKGYTVKDIDDFKYVDPIDASVSAKQV